MQKLAEICIRRPVFAMMIVLTLVVLGAAGYTKLGVDRFPSVDVPVVRINARLSGASPAEMESQVAQPIEEVVNTIEGIDELRSVNGAGNTFVVVTFNPDRDIDVAAAGCARPRGGVVRELPRDMDPPTISKSDTDQQPIFAHGFGRSFHAGNSPRLPTKSSKRRSSVRRVWAKSTWSAARARH